jgi:triacylglycerol esterase/lipase EstA (alpha/beta hydrolase family)
VAAAATTAGVRALLGLATMRRRVPLLLSAVVLVLAVGSPAASARSRRRAPHHDPVLLVHGFHGSGAGWHAMEAYLRTQGYRAGEIDAMNYDSDASNLDTARRIAREADALRARTGAARIDVVSHSMGAISSRYYLERLGGRAHVDAWVSLAGVNEGTVWAYGCYVLAPCREMVPSSSILHRLNDAARPPGPTRYAAWWSPCDEAIVPHANAELSGAQNVETACLGHSELKGDPTVLAQVGHFLDERPVRS